MMFAVALLLSAQQSLRSHLQPITAPIRRAGVYHVATGTWTRNASLSNVTGPDTIYNNTCAPVYMSRMQSGDVYQHRSRIPSTSGPTTPSIFYGPPRKDEAPGCHDVYAVNGFAIGYCSSSASRIDWRYDFASSFAGCSLADMIPDYSVLVTGLPGGAPGGGQACWIVDVDVSANSNGGFVLYADGEGTYGAGPADTFGFGFGPASSVALSDFTGPVLAGDFVWTGGPVVGHLSPCTGTDGTIWENPTDLSKPGTGMASLDYMRIASGSVSYPAGCYYMGGTVHTDFYLQLYANAQCPPSDGLFSFCWPGESGIHACTTCSPANPPSAHGRGCNNFGQHTGGAELDATGDAEVAYDTIVLTSRYENNSSFTVLLQGTATTNLVFGAGVRCAGGVLKRIYTGSAGSSANGDPPGTIHRPGPVDMRSLHRASLDVGYDIAAHAPVTLFYQAYYRDPSAAAHCGGATFNSSAGGGINWAP